MGILDYSRYSGSVRRKVFARILLSVFVPMLLMSVLHVHDYGSTRCAQIVPIMSLTQGIFRLPCRMVTTACCASSCHCLL